MSDDQISFGQFRLDLKGQGLARDGRPVPLGSRALDILGVLASARGDVVTKDQLMERVWPGRVVEENNIQVHISALRKALDDGDTTQSHVVTVPGRGYRLIGLHAPATADQAKSQAKSGNSKKADDPVEPSHDMRAVVRKELEGQSKAAIIILPIVCEEAQSPEMEREAARLTSDLIDFAPTITNLRVIAKSISSRLNVRSIDVSALGREFGAEYALEGSLRVLSGRLRVDIALIDLTTRLQAWNGYFESDESDPAARRLEIVRGLARQLVVAAVDVLGARPSGADPEGPLVDKLNRGWSLYQKSHSFRGGEEGQRIFEKILLDHPANRSALIGLAGFKIAAACRLARADRQSLVKEAEQLSQRALEIEAQASLNQYNLGEIALLNGQVDEAVFRYERTLAINPIHAPSIGQLALIDLSRRRFAEGLAKLIYIVRLSPNDWSLGYWYGLRGRIYFEMGEDAEAERWLRAGMLESPNRPQIRAALAGLYAETGQPERARKSADETRTLAPAARYETIRDYFFPGLTEPDEPRRMMSGIAKAFGGLA
jgi:DNA-binding winged helix-turn-helix (wHTH) protein